MRDARTVADRLLTVLPGFSEDVPARYDAFGDPVTVHKGLWVNTKSDLVDAEMRRMAEDAGVELGGPPSPTPAAGVDLRDITMEDGTNAYERLQQLAGRPATGMLPLKDLVGNIMQSQAYRAAPDGPATVQGTKQFMVSGVMARYHEVARSLLRQDPNVRDALLKNAQAVAGAYAAQRAQQRNPQSTPGGQQLKQLGDAFGVNLGPVLNGGNQ